MNCRAGPSLSAYNYDSAYGKRALVVMYKGIMEQVLFILIFKIFGKIIYFLLLVCSGKR